MVSQFVLNRTEQKRRKELQKNLIKSGDVLEFESKSGDLELDAESNG